jgi:hypothetical protein
VSQIVIRYKDVEAFVGARDRVVAAADELIQSWIDWPIAREPDKMSPEAAELWHAVHALRSLCEDRGVRDPGTPGEQASGAEQAHGPDPHD